MNNFFLRTYMEAKNEVEALEYAQIFESKLAAFCQPSLFKVKKYWKIPDHFEISFNLNTEQHKMEKITKLLGTQWEAHGDFYIWQHDNKTTFIFDKVRWASLEYL